jgi:hypothetical protein
MLAKTQGLALHDAVTVIGLHGPNKWAKEEGNQAGDGVEKNHSTDVESTDRLRTSE